MALAPARAAEIDAWLAEARAWTDRELDRLLPQPHASPRRLHEAMRYAVFGDGKRLRPAIARLVAAHFGGTEREAALVAAALECVHTYSLVHDDLPCMDDDDLRRGRPTVHRVFGEDVAVLCGDALLTHAFALLARTGPLAADLVGVLSEAAGAAGMVGGQDLDLEATRGAAATAPSDAAEVARIHELKTAALIAASAEMGAIAARARATERIAAKAYGLALGRCFQAIDDILDVTGDAATLGKTPGKDEAAGKATLVAALGLDGARQRAKELAAEARRAAEGLGCVKGDLAYDLVDRLLARRA